MTNTSGAAHVGWRQRLRAWIASKGSPQYDRLVADRKRELLGSLRGAVLEIGPGTAPNLKYFAPGVQWIGVEPDAAVLPYLRQEAQRLRMPIELRDRVGNRLPADDNTMDAVVSTLVLCSVPHPAAMLAEIRRVLKPGGHFVLIEHVAAPRGTWQRRLQDWLQPLWTCVDGECHPNREIWTALEQAGFGRVDYEQFRVRRGLVSPHIAGVLVK